MTNRAQTNWTIAIKATRVKISGSWNLWILWKTPHISGDRMSPKTSQLNGWNDHCSTDNQPTELIFFLDQPSNPWRALKSTINPIGFTLDPSIDFDYDHFSSLICYPRAVVHGSILAWPSWDPILYYVYIWATWTKPCWHFMKYWLVNRDSDSYNGWVVFHPLYTANKQGFGHCFDTLSCTLDIASCCGNTSEKLYIAKWKRTT